MEGGAGGGWGFDVGGGGGAGARFIILPWRPPTEKGHTTWNSFFLKKEKQICTKTTGKKCKQTADL